MRLPVNRSLPLAALTLFAVSGGLAACGGGTIASAPAPHTAATGPAADYPMVLGQPFVVDGVTYTPADVMNYDAVGYAVATADGGSGVTAAHRTLPVPSYVEVTSLDTGRTILVRIERRGPMTGNNLIALSPGAAAQLGTAGGRAAVRVRRVNPPEQERAMLRMGQPAPARMDTPKSLLTVLNRKLDQQPGMISGQAPRPLPEPQPVAQPEPSKPEPAKPEPAKPEPAKPEPAKPEPAKPAPAPKPKPAAAAPAAKGNLVVQVGAFSDKARAEAIAAKVGGFVSPAGKVWRVRVGPFQTQAQAEAALAKVRAAGYTEARIQHVQ